MPPGYPFTEFDHLASKAESVAGTRLNHPVPVTGGVRGHEAPQRLSEFFADRIDEMSAMSSTVGSIWFMMLVLKPFDCG
jgi:NADH:ubiquinone oxidoreductase subunit D